MCKGVKVGDTYRNYRTKKDFVITSVNEEFVTYIPCQEDEEDMVAYTCLLTEFLKEVVSFEAKMSVPRHSKVITNG